MLFLLTFSLGKISWKSNACSCGYFKLFKGREENIGCSQHAHSGNIFWTLILLSPWTLFFWNRNSCFLSNQLLLPVDGAIILPVPCNQGLGIIFEWSFSPLPIEIITKSCQRFFFFPWILSLLSFLFPLVTLWSTFLHYWFRNIVTTS